MLKGNTATGKSQRSNNEERPLNRKTLGTGRVRVKVLIIFKEMDLIYAIYRTLLNDVTVAFISHINIVSGSIKYEGEKSPNTCRFIYILNN